MNNFIGCFLYKNDINLNWDFETKKECNNKIKNVKKKFPKVKFTTKIQEMYGFTGANSKYGKYYTLIIKLDRYQMGSIFDI